MARGLWKEAASGAEGQKAIEDGVEVEGGWRLAGHVLAPVHSFPSSRSELPSGPLPDRLIYYWSKTGAVGLLITVADIFSLDLPGEGRSGRSPQSSWPNPWISLLRAGAWVGLEEPACVWLTGEEPSLWLQVDQAA